MSHLRSSTGIDRRLTADELGVVRWLLEHGEGDNTGYLKQLQRARVANVCGCGCASIDFSIDGQPPSTSGMRILSDHRWRDDEGNLYGAFVFEREGLLAGLDLWSIDGRSTPDAMPPLERLQRLC